MGRRTTWALAAGAGALGLFAARRAFQTRHVPPELRSPLLLVSPAFSPTLTAVIRRTMAVRSPKAPPGVTMSEHHAPPADGAPPVRLVVFERASSSVTRKPAMLWMHGGGYVIGTPEQDMALIARILDSLDIAIVSVDYRLAPDHPFPAPLDDCYAAFCWLVAHVADLAIDPQRIAIGGQSAGGGLAAALAQRVVHEGPQRPAFQLLVYPMLDAQTTARPDKGGRRFVWTTKSNLYGWHSYLGRDPTVGPYPPYAVPARHDDLTLLPPAWIGVGSLDLFHDEDIDYGQRLRDAGVPCEMYVVEGGYHGFDLVKPQATVTAQFYASMLAALENGLART